MSYIEKRIINKINPVKLIRPSIIQHNKDSEWITDKVCGVIENDPPLFWWTAFLICIGISSLTFIGLAYLVVSGVGVWGLASPINWGFAIINFVFWVGIGHAGTLISAILFLFKQQWRTSISRAAEAMTIFAVICAGIFPVFHVGRVWFAWWLFPIPNSNGIWPNFRSPLEWDVFAVSTYFTVSLIFWYMGMIPDLATLRDRSSNAYSKYCYGLLSMGWRFSNRHWSNYEMAYLLLAGLSTPLVISVHTIVSFDFATSIIPGWHTTIFPPYFVAGAILSGFSMVLTIIIPMRAIYKLNYLITQYHINCMCKIILATSMMVGYAYIIEIFIAWYSSNPFEEFVFANRIFGQYAWAYCIMFTCNVIFPNFLWFNFIREKPILIWTVCLLVNVGMWFERFVITVTSLSNDFLPSSWGYYSPTLIDVITFFGTFGIFSVLFLLFVRFLPLISISEVKSIAVEKQLLKEIKD